jgi:hypothetical protein
MNCRVHSVSCPREFFISFQRCSFSRDKVSWNMKLLLVTYWSLECVASVPLYCLMALCIGAYRENFPHFSIHTFVCNG